MQRTVFTMVWILDDLVRVDESYNLLEFPFLIGRNIQAHIICYNPNISKNHATITSDNGNLFITDTSINGVFVNNKRIEYNKRFKISNENIISLSMNKQEIGCFDEQERYIFKLRYVENISSACLTPPTSMLNEYDQNDTVIHKEKNQMLRLNATLLPTGSKETKLIDVGEVLNSSRPSKEVIVIEDDEEKENFLLSQLYIKSEPKSEPIDEDFLKIKQEIAEMDKFDSQYLRSPIWIDDDDDSSNSMCDDLLASLQTSKSMTKSPEISFEDYSPHQEQPTTSNKLKVITESICSKSPEINFEDPSPHQEQLSTSNKLKVITESICSKYVNKKPDIIQALPIASLSRKRRVATPEAEKQIKKTTTSTKNKKRKIKASSSEDARQIDNADTPKTKLNVKTSQSRGLFLINELPPNIQCKKSSNPPRIPRLKHVPDTALKPIASTSQCTTITNHQINRSDNPVFSNHQKTGSRPIIERKEHSSDKLLTDHKTFILRLLSWKHSYFSNSEKFNITSILEDIEGMAMTKLPCTYGDYRYYQRIMHMVVMSELFNDVFKEYSSTPYAAMMHSERRKTRVIVSRVNVQSDHYEIICYYYLDARVDKIMDCSLLSFISTGTATNNLQTYFGVVGWTTISKIMESDYGDSLLLKQCKVYPRCKLTFSIIAKKCIDVREKDHLLCRNFFSLRRYLKKLCAIQKVDGAVAQQILCPNLRIFGTHNQSKGNLEKPHPFLRMDLKQEQIIAEAIRFCSPSVESKFFLVQGPPGSGKSDVIVNIVINLLKSIERGTAIMLLAQSNAAVDNLMRRSTTLRRSMTHIRCCIRMVRIGQRTCTAPDVVGFHIDFHVSRNLRTTLFQMSPHLKQDYRLLEKTVEMLKRQKQRNFDEDILLKKSEQELKSFVENHFLHQYKKEEAKCRDLVFKKANLICSTIGSSYAFPNFRIKLPFKCCVIDEATQATEPDTLLPLTQDVPKFILVGDIQQLPAHSSLVPKEYLFSQSLFARLQRGLLKAGVPNALHILDTQYRMQKDICTFPNNQFYNGKLKTEPRSPREDIKPLMPYLVFEQADEQNASPYLSHHEIETISRIILMISTLNLSKPLSVGIITPYNEQKNAFLTKVSTLSLNKYMTVSVNTIDGFQGQEQDIILLSLVLKVANKFVDDPQRVNVALTRAKYCLYVVGSTSLFKSGTVLRNLQINAKHRGVYIRSSKYFDDTELRDQLLRH